MRFLGLVVLGPGRKRIRLNRKLQRTLWFLWFDLVHVFGRGCVNLWHSSFSLSDPKEEAW